MSFSDGRFGVFSRRAALALGLCGVLYAFPATAADAPAATKAPAQAAATKTVAGVSLPAIFSDHMVLQAGKPVRVWGWAPAGEAVTVEIAGQKKEAKTGEAGRWDVHLDPLAAGGPHTLTARGAESKSEATASDVLVGEVWLGSGQSNMAMGVAGCNDWKAEQAAAKHPEIRMFTVQSGAAETPQADCKGKWVVCAPDTVGSFSATLYFFGRDVQKQVGGAVGLVNSSVGGTPIENWIPREPQEKSPELKEFTATLIKGFESFDELGAAAKFARDQEKWKTAAAEAKAAGKPAPQSPRDPVAGRKRSGTVGQLYNGKIAPIVGYTIRGALWYQGEANGGKPKAGLYAHHLPLLVNDWRGRWGQGDFPFAWVQLPNFEPGGEWPTVREAMRETLRLPHTGMAITLDVGDAKDVHPKNKQAVGQRLAYWALANVYQKEVPAASGPLPIAAKLDGGAAVVSFDHAQGGLVAKGDLVGFEVQDASGAWKAAEAKIDGASVRVQQPDVPQPKAVRYAWKANPPAVLFNQAGLPASPFSLVPTAAK